MTGSPECDWPEDYELENGQYFCKCITCSADFIGHKRRHVCKRCEQDYQKYILSMAPAERTAHELTREQAIRDYVAEFCDRKPEKKFPCPAGVEDDCGYPACAHARQCERAQFTDTQRLDWLQANLKSPWTVYGTKYIQTTESVPRRTKEDVFEGWTLSDNPNEEPCPTIREAIDQEIRKHDRTPDT